MKVNANLKFKFWGESKIRNINGRPAVRCPFLRFLCPSLFRDLLFEIRKRRKERERGKREKAKEMSTDAKVSEWVDILSDCKVLSESEMKQLCDIVRGFLGTL